MAGTPCLHQASFCQSGGHRWNGVSVTLQKLQQYICVLSFFAVVNCHLGHFGCPLSSMIRKQGADILLCVGPEVSVTHLCLIASCVLDSCFELKDSTM